MGTKKGFSPRQARLAFDSIAASLETVSSSNLAFPRIETQRVAAIAFSIAERDQAPERWARFVSLGEAGFFDPREIRRLQTYALAMWYARQQQVRTTELASGAAVPAAVIQEAQALRARMLRVLDYHLSHDPKVAEQLAFIRAGSGYLDLANDLQQLADLYEDPTSLAAIRSDRRHYDPADADRAKALAEPLFRSRGLDAQTAVETWNGAVQRCWALLSRSYESLAATGRFAFRNDEDTRETYPSLLGSARSRRRRRTEGVEGELVEEAMDADEDENEDMGEFIDSEAASGISSDA